MLGGNRPSIWGSGWKGEGRNTGVPGLFNLCNLHRQMPVRQVCWGKMGGLETKEIQALG